MQLCVLFQLTPNNGDGRVHWERSEESLHVKRCNAFPFPMSDRFDLVHKVLCVPDMISGMSYQ